MTVANNGLWNTVASLLAVGLLSATLAAQPSSAARYDNQIQTTVTHKLTAKSQFRDVRSSVEDGIVTLTGTVGSPKGIFQVGDAVTLTITTSGVGRPITVTAAARRPSW